MRALVRQFFRHRYLLLFTIFGFISICIEVALVALLPESLGYWQRSLIGFLVGMVFAAFANAKFNFRVSNRRLWFTIAAFAGISGFSYSMNLMLLDWAHDQQWTTYPQSRFFTSGILFLLAYWLHRRLTFRGEERDLGLAVYLAAPTDVPKMYERVGELADHIHLDLVDETFRADCAPVDCGKAEDVLAY
jgi:putative flippase GtrA